MIFWVEVITTANPEVTEESRGGGRLMVMENMRERGKENREVENKSIFALKF